MRMGSTLNHESVMQVDPVRQMVNDLGPIEKTRKDNFFLKKLQL